MSKKLLNDGFTLIELMIVIAIIGILAAVLFRGVMGGPNYERQRCEQSGGTYSEVIKFGTIRETMCTYDKNS
jgi:prepilin-type N-terminal cleavage/methylation domain-containing protein